MDAAAIGSRIRIGASPKPALNWLAAAIDETGIRSNADGEASYRVADSGRALRLAVDLHRQEPALHLAELSLALLISAHRGAGHFSAATDAENALALRGIAAATAQAPWPSLRSVAQQVFHDARGFTPSSREAVAIATVAAAQVLAVSPTSTAAQTILANNEARLVSRLKAPTTPVEIEAGLLLAEHRSDTDLLTLGLASLDRFAERVDTAPPPAVSAIVDACVAALGATGDRRWSQALSSCVQRLRTIDLKREPTEVLLCALTALSQAQRAQRRRRHGRAARDQRP